MGLQPINVASSTQAQVLGTVIRARDVTYGEGEFIYLAGVASTAAGDAVCYNSKTGVTVRAVDGGATSIGAFAVAMAATTAGLFGWYQISGSGPINAATAAANTVAYLSSTAGQIDDTGTTAISGLTLTAATSAGFATVQVDRPAVSASSGGGTITFASVGAVPNAAGGSASGSTITLQPADATHPGLLTTAAQSIAGAKTFSGDIIASSYGLNATVGASYGFTWTSAGGGHLIAHAQAGNFDWSDGSVNQFLLTATSATFAGYVNAVGSYKISGTSVLSGSGTNTIVTSTGGTTAGNVYLSNQAEHFAVASDAGLELLSNVSAAFILRSPDGTRYKIVVANGGALSATAA